jgi:hypothetical protein
MSVLTPEVKNRVEEIKSLVLTEIEKRGYKLNVLPVNQTYYSHANTEEDNDHLVTNFYINKCKGWIFGLWIVPLKVSDFEAEENIAVDDANNDEVYAYKIMVFADYEKLTDKFKPTNTFFCEHVILGKSEKWDTSFAAWEAGFEINNIIELIRYRPYVAYYMTDTHLKYPSYKGSYFLYFIQQRIEIFLYEKRMKRHDMRNRKAQKK